MTTGRKQPGMTLNWLFSVVHSVSKADNGNLKYDERWMHSMQTGGTKDIKLNEIRAHAKFHGDE